MKIYILEKNNIPFYVGKSSNPPHRYYKHSKTYGKSISLEIIDEVEDNEWKFWEQYWICQFKTWGFKLENKNKGGGGPEKGRKLRTKDEEWKQKIGLSNKNRPKSKETKHKMSLSKKQKPSNFLGKTHSNITRIKISQTHSIKVDQYTREGNFIKTWDSIVLASKSLNIQSSSITGCCKNRKGYLSAGNYTWKYNN